MKQLAKLLQLGRLDGVVMDKFTYRYIQNGMSNSTDTYMKYFFQETVMMDIPHSIGRKTSYGILFRNEQLYENVKTMFAVDEGMALRLKVMKSFLTLLEQKEGVESKWFYMEVLYENIHFFSIVLGSMLVVGFVFEVVRRMNQLQR